MRRGLLIGLAALLTVAAILGVLAFFSARDDSTIGEDRQAPGQEAPSLTADRLRRGNVVLAGPDPAALRAVAREVGAPDGPAAVEAGQAVIVERRAGGAVVAEAYRRRIEASGPGDPALREFVQYWLGRAALRE